MASRWMQQKVHKIKTGGLRPRFADDNMQETGRHANTRPGRVFEPRNVAPVVGLDGVVVTRCDRGAASGLDKDVGRMGKARATRAQRTYGNGERRGSQLVWADWSVDAMRQQSVLIKRA